MLSTLLDKHSWNWALSLVIISRSLALDGAVNKCNADDASMTGFCSESKGRWLAQVNWHDPLPVLCWVYKWPWVSYNVFFFQSLSNFPKYCHCLSERRNVDMMEWLLPAFLPSRISSEHSPKLQIRSHSYLRAVSEVSINRSLDSLDPATLLTSPKFRSRNESYMRAMSTISQVSDMILGLENKVSFSLQPTPVTIVYICALNCFSMKAKKENNTSFKVLEVFSYI